MKKFLQNIQTRFGTTPALITELWINFYMYGLNLDDEELSRYTEFVKIQMRPLLTHFGINSATFNQIVEESKSFLQTNGQTIH